MSLKFFFQPFYYEIVVIIMKHYGIMKPFHTQQEFHMFSYMLNYRCYAHASLSNDSYCDFFYNFGPH